MFLKIYLFENRRKCFLVRIPSSFFNVFVLATKRRAAKETDTYTASTRYWLRDVTYHNLDTYQYWRCLIESRFSRHVWLVTYLRWCHKIPNPKFISKKMQNYSTFRWISVRPSELQGNFTVFNVCTVWLYTHYNPLSNKISSTAHHITLTGRSFALGFCKKLKLYSS